MNTKVRISEYTSGQYGHYEIQILEKYKHSYAYPAYNVIGSITWQCTVGEDRVEDKWYGMRLHCQCELHDCDHLAKMAAIAKKLYQSAVTKQPDEIMAIMQAERMFLHCGKYYPASYEGQKSYRVIKADGEHYANLVAPNEIVAARLAKKWYKLEVVEFDHIVSFN